MKNNHISFPGLGGKKGAVERCPNCRGSGMQVRVQQIGPGMVQQIQSVCGECQGQGERINAKDRCKVCLGKKVLQLNFWQTLNFADLPTLYETNCFVCPFLIVIGEQREEGSRSSCWQRYSVDNRCFNVNNLVIILMMFKVWWMDRRLRLVVKAIKSQG